MKKRYLSLVVAGLLSCGIASQTSASIIEGGDVATMAEADVVLDIVFAIDTSGSMSDEIDGLSSIMAGVINNLSCPDCNSLWVRADFYGIDGTSGIFDERVDNITGNPADTVTNQLEDNAPAVTDLVSYYNYWGIDDSASDQDYYKAIVTIGDEGTEDGYPVYQDDWDAAYVANQAAINNGFMVFSVVGTPYYPSDQANRDDVFSAMAIGGTGGGYTFGDTGGGFTSTTSGTLQSDIEGIICRASGCGDVAPVPEPATMFLFGTGLIGLIGYNRKRFSKKD